MAGEGENFQIEIQGQLNAILLLVEAYKADVITLAELVNGLVAILYQD